MERLDEQTALSHAWLCVNFLWQDEAAGGLLDGAASVSSADVIGTLPEEVNGSPVFVIHVEGIAISTFGYFYPVERDVKVELHRVEGADEDRPLTSDATSADVEAARQHMLSQVCEEYTHLMRDNSDQARLIELRNAALADGLHFTLKDGTYVLETATQEELDAYVASLEDDEDDD